MLSSARVAIAGGQPVATPRHHQFSPSPCPWDAPAQRANHPHLRAEEMSTFVPPRRPFVSQEAGEPQPSKCLPCNCCTARPTPPSGSTLTNSSHVFAPLLSLPHHGRQSQLCEALLLLSSLFDRLGQLALAQQQRAVRRAPALFRLIGLRKELTFGWMVMQGAIRRPKASPCTFVHTFNTTHRDAFWSVCQLSAEVLRSH
jgi:hypothetical protein